jgi:hypothetical protein
MPVENRHAVGAVIAFSPANWVAVSDPPGHALVALVPSSKIFWAFFIGRCGLRGGPSEQRKE